MTTSWTTFRQAMPAAERLAYFDHAAVAPLPSQTRDAIAVWLTEAAETGDVHWPQWAAQAERCRQRAARTIAARETEIALVPNTTAGITLVAEGWRWRPGENVITVTNEFPSNQYPWLNLAERGVEIRRVDPRPDGSLAIDDLLAAADARTRLIAVSWVGYATGYRLDVAELVERCHAKGVLVFLDAIQGLGVFPLDVQDIPIDFLAADGHKWLLGPEGAGLFYVREEHLDKLRPLGVGWNSVARRYDFHHIEMNLRPEAARYEGGSLNMAGFMGLGESLELLHRHGLESNTSLVGERVLDIAELAKERLRAAGAELKYDWPRERGSGIVVFNVPGRDPAAVRERCLQAGVILSLRGGGLRISPHAYNNEEDVERLVEAIAE